MKNINRLLAAAAILLSAAACHTNEIDPVKPDPVNPGESGLTITANIVKTRVTYNDRDEGYLDQYWETGDVLFGYYGEDVGNKVILTVSDFDGSGNAILTPVNDEVVATLEELAELDSEVPVDLVYTGANVTAEDYPFDGDGKLVIDMRLQDGANIPACMHARAYVQGGKNKKTLFFKFVNDCAIIEICSLTGLKEEDIDGGALTSLSVSNLVLEGNYSLGADGFILAAKTEILPSHEEPETVLSDYEKDFGANDGWKVSANAEIMKDGSTVSRYMIAVVPNAEPQEIEVSATVEGVQDSFSHYYGLHAFSAGRCYVISEADVVAKTVDGKYFSTVKEAFDYASGIRSSYPNNNIVTLIKDGIYGLVEHAGPIDSNEGKIVIDYTVTLDLNGCSLSLGNYNEEEDYDDFSVSEFFDVTTNGTFTITDLSGCEEAGCISADGNSATSIIENKGTVIIENGFIDQWGSDDVDEPIIIENYGSLTVEGGNLSNSCGAVIDSKPGSETYIGVENDTNLEQEDYSSYKLSISSDFCAISIQSDGSSTDGTKFEMKGGYVSGDNVAVKLDGSDVCGKISGGEISGNSTHGLLVQAGAKCEISGGYVSSSSTGAVDSNSAVYLNDASIYISGGEIYSNNSYAIYCVDSDCTISYLTINNTPSSGGEASSIYCTTTDKEEESYFVMSGGSITGGNIKIWLDKNITGKISGGTITSSGCYAIRLSGSELTIDEENDNTITISTGSQNGFPAIFVEDSGSEQAVLNVKSGIISGVGNPYEHSESKVNVVPAGAIELTGDVVCNISGGSISSSKGYAILVGENAECNISGSNTTLKCTEGCAIKNNGKVDISGGNISSVSNGKSNIKGSDVLCYYGTVENYAAMTISGGTISSGKSDTTQVVSAVTNRDDGVLTISGGKIMSYSETNPAVYSFRNYTKTGDDPDLTIKWAEGSSESDSPRVGPLIVSTNAHGLTYGPVSAANDSGGSTNYAIVEISGGYLSSCDDAFCSIAGESSLVRPEGTYFYSNKEFYYDFTMAENNLVSVPYEEGTDITDPVLGKLTFDYKITSVSEEPSTDPDPIKSRFL